MLFQVTIDCYCFYHNCFELISAASLKVEDSIPLSIAVYSPVKSFKHKHENFFLQVVLHCLTASAVSQWSRGNIPDCGVRGPRFESHHGQLCLSRQPLRYAALGTGCTPLLQCVGRLSLPSSVGR